MPKRKPQQNAEQSDEDSDVSIVDVDFDFCDFKPEIDYIAIKRLLQQLLYTDAPLFDLGAIADLVLSQDDVGSTVKTDSADSDPLSFLAVLNLNIHHSHSALANLRDYLLSKISVDQRFHQTVKSVLGNQENTSAGHLGLIIGERVYNMPPQVMPPSYQMLHDEIQWALEDNKPYRFSHYLILSRIWRASSEEEAGDASASKNPSVPSKRRKTTSPAPAGQSGPKTHSFHPEDACIQKAALYSLDFEFSHQEARTKESMGTDIAGRVMLVPSSKLGDVVRDMARTFPPPSWRAIFNRQE